MSDSQIDYVDKTLNAVLGCTKISAACRFCWAIKTTWRLAHNPLMGTKYQGLVEKDLPNGNLDWTGTVRCLPSKIIEPLKWREPKRIFVCSQADLWHEKVPFSFIDALFSTMARTPWHTYITLTKRPDRMLEWANSAEVHGALGERFKLPLGNVWCGVTAENQFCADQRIPLLLQVPAKVHWVSVEPMLGPVDLTGLMAVGSRCRIERIDWCVIGAEHAKHARPTQLDWIRSLVQQCTNAGTKVFIKQARIDGKLVKMPEINGRIYAEYPEQEVA